MALSDGLGIQALVQSYDKKAISQAFTEIASQLNKSVDDLNDDLNKIKIDKDVVNNLVNQLKALPEEIRKKTQGMSFDLFSDLINADGAEEKIDKAIETFSNKMKSFVKLRDSIGNDKIIIETDLSDLDELIKKEEKILSLETQIQGLRQQTKKYRTGNDQIKSIEDEINAWVQNRQQVDKYNVEIDEVKKNITELAKSNRNINWSNIDNKNVDTIKEMVGWLERYVQLTGDISGLKELNIPGVIDLRKLFSGDITSVDPNLTQQVKDFQDMVKRYSGNFNTDVNIQSSGSIDTQKLKEQEQEINKIRESLTKTESQLEQVNQKYSEQSNLVSELENKLKALEGISNPKVIETDEYKNIISELESAKNKASEFQAELDETKQTVEVLKNSLSSYNTGDVVPRQDFENANSIIDNLSSKIKELETSLTEIESKFTSLSSEVTTLQQDKSDLSGQLSQQKEINATQQEQISNSQKIKIELDEIKKKYQDLTNSIKEMEDAQSRYMSLLDRFGQAEAFNEAMRNVDYNEGENTPEGFVNFDYLEKAKQKLQETGNAYEKATKAAVYYYQYLQKGGTEKIFNKDGKDISNELISLYKEMSSLADDKTGQISYESINKTVREYANELRLAREEQSREKELINQKNKELKETLSLEKKIAKTKQESKKAEEQTKDTTVKTSGKRTTTRKELVSFTTARQKEQQINQGDSSDTSQPLQQDSSSILSEQQALEKLEQAINSVTIAIAQKNKAIQAEEVQMDKSVNSEIAKLEELKGKLNEIKTQFEQGIESGFFKNINSEDVDGNFVNIDLKPAVDANKFKEDAERLLTFVDVEKEVNLKVGELDTSNITDTTSTVTSPVSENIANDNVIEEQNKDLEEQQRLYNNIIRLLTEYLSLQDRINSGNRNIASGDLIYSNDIRKQTGKVSQRAVKDQLNNYLNTSKNENGVYNDDSIKRAKEQLAAYVANFDNAEKAAEIFGNKNKELFNEIIQMINDAKVSLDAYNKAQLKIDVAESQLSELNKLQSGEKLTFGQLWDLEKFVKTDGLEAGLKYITDELGIKIPEAAKKAESAISGVNDELSKPQQKTSSTKSDTGNDQEEKKSDVITVPVEPILIQSEWESEIDRILEAIGTKKIKIEPDTTTKEWNDFKTYIEEISNLTIHLTTDNDDKQNADNNKKTYSKNTNSNSGSSSTTTPKPVTQNIPSAPDPSVIIPIENLSEEWENARKAAQLYDDELSEIVNVTKQIRTNEKTGERLISYRVSDDQGKQVTVGKNWNLISYTNQIADQVKAAKEQQKQQEKLQKYYQSLQDKSNQNKISEDNRKTQEANKLLTTQQKTYEQIYDIKAKIAALDPDDDVDSKQIDLLNQQKKLLQENYLTQKKQLDDLSNYYSKQDQSKALSDIADIGLKKIEVNAAKLQERLNKQSSTPKVSSDKNLIRVNTLYDQQLATIKEINALESIDDNSRTVSQNERLTQLNEELLNIHKQIDAELDSEYTKTARIQKVLDEMVNTRNKVNSQGVSSINLNQQSLSGRETDIGVAYDEALKVNSALNRTSALMDELSHKDIANFDKPFDNASIKISVLNQRLASGSINLATYDNSVNKVVSSLRNIVAVLDDTANQADGIEAVQRYINQLANGADVDFLEPKTVGAVTTLTAEFKNQEGQLQRVNVAYNDINKQVTLLRTNGVKQVGSLSKFIDELGAKFRNLRTYLLSFVGFYEVWGAIQQGVTYVRELDTALTEMRKVSDETVDSLREFQEESFDIADSVGATAKTIQNSTADWMRLGESIEEAAKSAEVSNILLNVSEFTDINDATDALVSMSQAYNEFEKIDIVDKLNNIGM